MSNKPFEIKRLGEFTDGTLSVNESALAKAMLVGSPDGVVHYGQKGATKVLDTITSGEVSALLDRFKKDPKETIAVGRQNVFSVMNDDRLSESERLARVKRYVKAFLSLQIRLDLAAFSYDNTTTSISRSVPLYLPHGLVDMGSKPSITDRGISGREMIRINKIRIYEQNLPRFIKYFSRNIDDSSSTKTKKQAIRSVAIYVYNQMPYDHHGQSNFLNTGELVDLDRIYAEGWAVCRHHALYTQVILQALGVTSRLIKCDVDFGGRIKGPHVANAVRINGKWYLLDTTNPDVEEGIGKIFLVPVPDKDIDPNKQYEWKFRRSRFNEMWQYKTRNNMYHFISQ